MPRCCVRCITKGVRITELGNQQQALTERADKAGKAQRDTETRLQKVRTAREALAETGSPGGAAQAGPLARKRGDLDDMLRAGRDETESLEKACLD